MPENWYPDTTSDPTDRRGPKSAGRKAASELLRGCNLDEEEPPLDGLYSMLLLNVGDTGCDLRPPCELDRADKGPPGPPTSSMLRKGAGAGPPGDTESSTSSMLRTGAWLGGGEAWRLDVPGSSSMSSMLRMGDRDAVVYGEGARAACLLSKSARTSCRSISSIASMLMGRCGFAMMRKNRTLLGVVRGRQWQRCKRWFGDRNA